MAHHVFHRGSVEGGVLTPDQVSGLWAWYSARDASTLWEDSARTTPASNGGAVQAWDDKSGNGRHVLSALPTSADIAYVSSGLGPASLPYVDFKNATNSKLLTAGNETWVASGFEIITLIHSQSAGASIDYLVTRDNANLGVYCQTEAVSATGPGFYDGTAHRNFSIGAEINRAGVFSWQFGADNEARFREGQAQLGADVTFSNFSTGADEFQLGESGAVCDAWVTDIAIWHRDLTDAERTGVIAGFLAVGGL